MSVAIRAITRIVDADDAPSLGAGQSGYALTWNNATGAFVATALFSGGLLATGATTGATSQAQTFTNGIIGPSWKPASDSTTALQMQQADGTAVLTVDTTNKRVGIGTAPSTAKLDVYTTESAATFFAGSSGASIFKLYSTGTDNPTLQFGISGVGTSPFGFIQAADDGSYRPIIMNQTYGNVGIGLSDPDSVLHVSTPFFAADAVGQLMTLSARYGTAASAGFGSSILWELKSSTTADQSAAMLKVLWYEATHASRKADLVASAYDTAEREGLRIRGNGSAAAIGFLGATPQARIAHVANPSGGATVDTEARSAINSILSTLELFGFHATS